MEFIDSQEDSWINGKFLHRMEDFRKVGRFLEILEDFRIVLALCILITRILSSTLHTEHLQGDAHTLERTCDFKGRPSPYCFIGQLVCQSVAFEDWYKQVLHF